MTEASQREENRDADLDATHPGFACRCDACGSYRVYVQNSTGWSPESGGWGSISLICDDCGKSCDIWEPV